MPANIENMLYRGETPWHGLGHKVTGAISRDEALSLAGFTWQAHKAPVTFQAGDEWFYMEDRNVLYRDDTSAPLGIVSNQYNIVQPAEVYDFFEDIIAQGDFELETAGTLDGGKKLWCLAKATKKSGALHATDRIEPYLFLATSMDLSMATTASFTTVRIVCQNTLQMATRDNTGAIKVTHRGTFNRTDVQQQLGLLDTTFDKFMLNADHLASTKVTAKQTDEFIGQLFNEHYLDLPEKEQTKVRNTKPAQLLLTTLNTYPGQDLITTKATAWGLVNGVTAYVDHTKNTRTQDARLDQAWFGAGRNLKQKALDLALELV